jgi:hypothetical protein
MPVSSTLFQLTSLKTGRKTRIYVTISSKHALFAAILIPRIIRRGI